MKRLLLLLPLIAGCGAFVQEGPTLNCYRTQGPCDENEFLDIIATFTGWVPGFDGNRNLQVNLYDDDVTWTLKEPYGTITALGYTDQNAPGSPIYIDSLVHLPHELMHEQFARTTGDGDANHSTPPGPWTEDTDASIEAMKVDLGL